MHVLVLCHNIDAWNLFRIVEGVLSRYHSLHSRIHQRLVAWRVLRHGNDNDVHDSAKTKFVPC